MFAKLQFPSNSFTKISYMTWICSVHTLLLNNKIHECDNVDMALAQSVYEANSFYINLTSRYVARYISELLLKIPINKTINQFFFLNISGFRLHKKEHVSKILSIRCNSLSARTPLSTWNELIPLIVLSAWILKSVTSFLTFISWNVAFAGASGDTCRL